MAKFDRAGEAFLRALDEAGRSMPAETEAHPPPPRAEAPASVGLSPGEGGGGEARWDFAMRWTDEWAPPLAPASGPSGKAEVSRSEAAAIAEELGLGTALTPRQLAARWRNFIWRNHPDRQPAHERSRAGAELRSPTPSTTRRGGSWGRGDDARSFRGF